MSNPDREYLERRRAQSLPRAEAATDPSVALVHYSLADAYQRKLDAAEIRAAPPVHGTPARRRRPVDDEGQ